MAVEDNWETLSVQQRFQTSVGAPQGAESAPDRVGILSPLRRRLMVTDAALILFAMLLGLFVSSRASAWAIDPLLAIYGVPVAIAILWWSMLALRGSYDQRVIGLGTEEIRRVVSATLYTFAVVAGVSFLIRADISRAYAFVSLPVGLLLITAGRFAWRSWLYRQRAAGRFMNRTIIVGSGPAADELQARLEQDSFAGYSVVASFPPPRDVSVDEDWLSGLSQLVDATGVEAVAVAPSDALTGQAVRQIAWQMEGKPVDLLIAPAMMETGGTRLSVRPAAGLPLLYLEEASLSRPQRFAKRVLDLVGAILAVVLLSPVLIGCAIWVRLTSKGPVIFRQTRVGRAGEPFTMLKFRTMVKDADSQREILRSDHALTGPMFKLDGDPRITSAGRFLRRWSLDELPQLFNVIGGAMSLVGPRPHPMDDVNRYEVMAYRRLALKPGMTGLWQVEGRSDLSWQEALQLDLFYVESWSLSGDAVLLARTVRAVIQGRGAV